MRSISVLAVWRTDSQLMLVLHTIFPIEPLKFHRTCFLISWEFLGVAIVRFLPLSGRSPSWPYCLNRPIAPNTICWGTQSKQTISPNNARIYHTNNLTKQNLILALAFLSVVALYTLTGLFLVTRYILFWWRLRDNKWTERSGRLAKLVMWRGWN